MGRRREQRIEINLPVRVWGMDGSGNPFIQSAHTMDVTRNGARLRELFCVAKAGEIIRIQHGLKKANFRIAWIGHPGTPAGGQVGIHCLEPDKYIWGVPLPKASPVDAYVAKLPELPPPLAMRAAAIASATSSTSSSTAVAAQPAKAMRVEDRRGEMRAHTRYACDGSVEVAPEGSNMPIWCGLSDLSISGCYAETTTPLPVDTRVHARLKIFGTELHAHGAVRTSHPGVGMGISFAEMREEDQRRIYCILEIMAEKAANGSPANTANPNSAWLAQKSVPPPHRGVLVFHNRSQQENTQAKKAPPSADPQLADRLRQLHCELQDLPQTLRSGTMDSRIVHEVNNVFGLARQTVAAVQQWMELEAQGRDPFQVLQKLNGERVQAAGSINDRLAMDIDAGEVDFDTAGLNELYQSTENLHSRLQKLCKKM